MTLYPPFDLQPDPPFLALLPNAFLSKLTMNTNLNVKKVIIGPSKRSFQNVEKS